MNPNTNHLCFTPEQFLRLSKDLKRKDRAVYFNLDTGTIWIARSLRDCFLIKVLTHPKSIRNILKHFCPMFREVKQ